MTHQQVGEIITRDEVHQWLDDWDNLPPDQKKGGKRKYIASRMDELQPGLSEETVSVDDRDDYPGPEVLILTTIMDDLPSYG